MILPDASSYLQEYIRRQLEEEQRHLEKLQEQLLREQAMLLVSLTHVLTVRFPVLKSILRHKQQIVYVHKKALTCFLCDLITSGEL